MDFFFFFFFFFKSKKKISKIILKNLWFFSNIFYQFFHNIGLYIYIVKYKSGIKIPGFLRNVLKFFFQNNHFKKKSDFLAYFFTNILDEFPIFRNWCHFLTRLLRTLFVDTSLFFTEKDRCQGHLYQIWIMSIISFW